MYGPKIPFLNSFVLDSVNNSGYSLKSEQRRKFLSSNNSGGNLIINASAIGQLEIFRITDKTKGTECF